MSLLIYNKLYKKLSEKLQWEKCSNESYKYRKDLNNDKNGIGTEIVTPSKRKVKYKLIRTSVMKDREQMIPEVQSNIK